MAKTTRPPKEAAKLFESIIKASVAGNPKPKPKKSRLVVIKPQYITEDLLFLHGFEPVKPNIYRYDDIDIKREKGNKFFHANDILKIYLVTWSDLEMVFIRVEKPVPELVDY